MRDPLDAAFEAAPRAAFLPPRARHRAGHDGPIHIGRGQTSSQPRTVRAMLELLEVRAGQHVLDVGAGSGWTTALLAELVGPDGRVHGVELEPSLARWGAANLARGPWTRASIAPARPGVLGLPEHAPYDRVLVSAEADALPGALLAVLADDARMVVPVRGEMTLVVRSHGHEVVTTHGAYRFVPLR